MSTCHCAAAFLLWLAFPGPAQADEPNPAAIMARVAANVEKAADARRHYVYSQFVTSSLVRGNGAISRKEKREYQVFPTATATEKKLVSLDGQCRQGKAMVPYTEAGYKYKGMDIDGELIQELTDDLVNEKDSRDGIPHSLFPLEAKALPGYHFSLKEEFQHQGRRTYKILFEPAERHTCVNIGGDDDCESPSWKGEAWIDADDLQPAHIDTHLAFRIPWSVRVFLGTNLQQTGFTISYQRLAEDVWFPVTYGTEFRLNVLWGYKRTITLSLVSKDFKKTGATSKIEYVEVKEP